MKQHILLFAVIITLAGSTGCRKPKACLQPSVSTANLGEQVLFTDCSEHAHNYSYDFGDGSPKAIESTTAHTYTTPGLYTVTVEVSNKRDRRETEASTIITVKGITVGDFTVSEWELYKTAEYDEFNYFPEGNIQSPGHRYRFASDSVYIYDGFSNPLPYAFQVTSSNQFTINGILYRVVRNHNNEIWYRTNDFGFYTMYYLKKI